MSTVTFDEMVGFAALLRVVGLDAPGSTSEVKTPCFVNFRAKGEDPQGGGYLRVENDAERFVFTEQMKSADARVEWEPFR